MGFFWADLQMHSNCVYICKAGDIQLKVPGKEPEGQKDIYIYICMYEGKKNICEERKCV